MKQVQPGAYKVNDFDFNGPKTPLLGGGTKDRSYGIHRSRCTDFCANYADEERAITGQVRQAADRKKLQAQYDF